MGKTILTSKRQLRRSTRQRKAPKDDEYWRGLPNQMGFFAGDISDEQTCPKRKRKSKYDDNQDYEGGYKSNKKKIINANKIQALLEWREKIQDQQLKIITDQQYRDPNTKFPLLFKEKISKNISNQRLQDIVQNVEALFINIQWNKKGQTIQDFEKLKIQSAKFMSKGIAFVWAPKQLVSDILEIMNRKKFFYVQNLEVINFDREKAIRQYCPNIRSNLILNKQKSQNTIPTDEISQSELQLKDILKHLVNVQPNDLIIESKSEYFNSSKRTLLMFRKTSNEKVQLRHQRTCDVVFDMPVNPQRKLQYQIKRYIYNMIETLLPEALIIEYKNKSELAFKMIQLWGDIGTQRRGWINIVQQ